MAVSDGTPPGDAGAGDAGAPPAPQAPAAQTPAAARPFPSTPAANGGAEDVLRTFVRSSVEKILKEAPWTFHKVNPLKEACRQFLREVDEEVAVEPKASTPDRGGSDVTDARDVRGSDSKRVTSNEREGTTKARLETTTTTRRLALSATRALAAACDSGRPALAEPALRAAHKLIAGGFLVGTTNVRNVSGGPLVRESRTTRNDANDDDATTEYDGEKRTENDGATNDANADATRRTKPSPRDDVKTDFDDAADGSCRALVDALCACASAIPDGSSLSGGASSGSAQTYAVAAVGALLACAVSEHLRLEGESLADALSALLRVCASVSSPETRAAAKTATTQLINVAFQRAGGFANVVNGDVADSETPPTPLTPREADALLVLLTLCERAAAPGSGEEKARAAETRRRARGAEASPPDPFAAMATAFQPAAAALVAAETRAARTRAVSLDLLRQLLEGPGSKAWLVRLAPFLGKPLRLALGAGVDVEGAGAGFSLEKTKRASAPAVARADPATAATASLARAAFTSLVLRARHAYKPAVARLYPRMALAPLEGPSRGGGAAAEDAKAKLAALRVIRALASDPQVLVDVFVNHDCDARGDNLYERTIGALASTMAPGGGDQQRLRDGAVQCVLATVQSLRAWHARGAEPTPLLAGGSESLGTRGSGGRPRAEREPGSDREASATIANGMEITPGGERAAFEDTRSEPECGHEEKEKLALTESETFASLKKRKANFEAATSAFNARPSVLTLAAVMEISREDIDEAIDVADSRFPKRAAAFLAGRDAFFGDDVDPDARKENSDDSEKRNENEDVGDDVTQKRHTSRGRSWTLDPSAVGELLGSHDVDALRVMKAYADAHDFRGLVLDEALRVFFKPFRVPGEAQKIDRLVERFAARHCECNPGDFEDPDQAYVLAFAVVMLNTDAHNPKTDPKTKMSEDAFVAMAREGMKTKQTSTGTDDTRDRERPSWTYESDTQLRGVFRRVAAKEIEMSPGLRERARRGADAAEGDEEDEEDDASVAIASSRRHAADALAAAVTETEAALERARELFSSSRDTKTKTKPARRDEEDGNVSPFFAASDPSLARPMLETAGPPLLRAVSRAFANADDAAHAALPLEGARAILALASALKVPPLRDSLCDFLARAPGLGRGLGLDERGSVFLSEKGSERGTPGVGRHAVEAARLVSKKRVEAARTLLDLAAEASGLGEENWPVVLEVVSRMDALREAAELLEARRRTSEEEASEREEPPEVEQETHERHLARLVTCARAPLRFAREEAHEARERDAALVSVSSSTAIPSAPTGAEVALGAWLASAEGAAASRRVFADAARFDDVEATGFVAALAGVAVADVWAPAEDAAARLGSGDPRRSEAFGQRKTSPEKQKTSLPSPSACPRVFAATRLTEVTARFLLERPRALLRTEIWSARVAPVLAGMAAHPDAAVVRAAAEGLYVTAARFAARADFFAGGSPAAAAAAFAPFADAHRWAVLAECPDPRSERDGSASEEVLRTSRLARRLAAASAGRLVSALASETGGENGQKLNESKAERTRSPLTPSEIAGWRAGLSVARAFAGDPDDSVVLAYLENAACAVVETAARTTRAAAKKALETNSRIALDSADAERAFAADAAAALLAFATRRFPPNASNSNEAAAVVAVSAPSTRAPPRGAAARAACDALRDVAVAAAEASAELEKNCSTASSMDDASSVDDACDAPVMMAGERIWLACVESLASASDVEEADVETSLFALERAFEVLRRDASAAFAAGASWSRALRAVASASLDVDARARRTANAKETWETTTRAAAAWCARRARVACRGGVALVFSRDGAVSPISAERMNLFSLRRHATLRASFPHAHLAAMSSAAVAGLEPGLADVVGACCVELARALAATGFEEDAGPEEEVRERAWRGVAAALEATVAVGVAAACESVSPQERLGGASARGQSVSSDCASVSSAGAYAAAAACDAAAKILRFSRETFEDSVSSASGSGAVPEGTRLALLNVLARAHAASAKANAASVAAAGTAFASSASSESSSIESLLGGRDRLVSLETFAGGALVAALRREANRGDAGTETRAAAADRLGATCAATLVGIVAIAAPPPFPRPIGLLNTGARTGAVRFDANETDDATTETASDDAWLAAAAARRDAGVAREPLAAAALDALASLRETHASAFFRRGAAATAAAAALVAVARPPVCAAAGRFFEALATAPSWSLEGTGVSEDEEEDDEAESTSSREAEAKEVAETSVVVPAARAPNDSAKNDSAKEKKKKKSPTRPPSHLSYAAANGASDD